MQGIAACLIALVATGALIRLLVPLSGRIGLVDTPRGHKTHRGQVPLVGGIAMFCGFLFAILVPAIPLYELRPLFAGSALLVIVGAMDDLRSLDPPSRFAAQIAAALLMSLWGGVTLHDLGRLIGPEHTLLGLWAVPVTLISVVGVINALNMLDGLDGLAGGSASIAFAALALAAWDAGLPANALALSILCAAVLGFLAFNLRLAGRPQALVFMGNAGSMFLGFALAWFLVRLSQGEGAPIDPVTALWILALPLMDTVGIMLRRVLHGRSPLLADREHLHHLIVRLGLGTNRTVALLLGASALLTAAALGAQAIGIPERYRFAAFVSLFFLYFMAVELLSRRLSRRLQDGPATTAFGPVARTAVHARISRGRPPGSTRARGGPEGP